MWKFSRSRRDGLERGPPTSVRSGNQARKYKHDPEVDRVLRSTSAIQNSLERDVYNNIVKEAAVGLHKHYKSKNKKIKEDTEAAVKYLAENLDGRSFTQLNKIVHDLRAKVLNDPNHTLSPDSFLVFLDKIRSLSPIESRNQQIMRRLTNVDISLLTPARLMANYQKNSVDFKFEKTIRMDEIKQFAANVVPKPRFIFDNYRFEEEQTNNEQ